MDSRRLVVVTPCRDEEDHIEAAVASVVAQTQRPDVWIIVDDGSSDATPRMLQEVAQRHDWIRVVTMPPRQARVLGAGVVVAFNAGLATVDLADYDYVSKLDMDVELAPTYFETILDRMEQDPRLATASGSTLTENSAGQWVPERGSFEMSTGMAKVYRRTAFEDIGGLVPQVMWDGIDCHESRVRGWRARSYEDAAVQIRTFRAMGSSDRGIFRGRRRHGRGQWYMGTGPFFMAASALLRARDEPRVLGSANMLAGYARAAVTRHPRYGDKAFRRQLRQFQRESLVLGKRRAVERWEARREGVRRGAKRPQTAYLVSRYPAMSHAFITTEIEALRKLGWDVTTFSVRPGDTQDGTVSLVDQPVRRLVGDVARLGVSPRSVAGSAAQAVLAEGRIRAVGAGYWAEAASLLAHLDRRGLTHVHVHFANNAAEVARLVVAMDAARAQPRGITWSFTLHGLWMHGLGRPEGPGFPLANADRWGPLATKVATADGIVAVTEVGRRALEGLATAKRPVRTVHLGVDTTRFSPAPVRIRTGDGLQVLYVGRFAPEKALDVLLRAVAQVDVAHLTLVGQGPEETRLRALAADLAMTDRVRWHGPAEQRDLPALYRQADVFAMTSLNEGIPVVLMEAMACGLPVVATDVGGIAELVTPQTGVLVSPSDPAPVAAALRRLAGDPATRGRMGAAARDRVVDAFDRQDQARRMSAFLAEVGGFADPARSVRLPDDTPIRLPNQASARQNTR